VVVILLTELMYRFVVDDIDMGQISFNSVPDQWAKYIPHELFDNSQLKAKSKSRNIDFKMLQNLEQQEKSGDGDKDKKKEDGESDGEVPLHFEVLYM
jgi:hypothetical protein